MEVLKEEKEEVWLRVEHRHVYMYTRVCICVDPCRGLDVSECVDCMSNLWVAQNPEEGIVLPCVYTIVVRDTKRVGQRICRSQLGRERDRSQGYTDVPLVPLKLVCSTKI